MAVVDPGHGGDQDGALAPDGKREKELALQIARRVASRLQRQGARVLLTRTGDVGVPLAERAALANSVQADIFVSVHLNSMPSKQSRKVSSGVETYFLSADATDASDPVAGILDDLQNTEALSASSRLAYAIHERLIARTRAENRGVKQAPFYVLAGARMPAVLLEVGFISHGAESKKLEAPAYQEVLAQAVAEGVAAWRKAGGAGH